MLFRNKRNCALVHLILRVNFTSFFMRFAGINVLAQYKSTTTDLLITKLFAGAK